MNCKDTYGLVHAIYGRGKGKTSAAIGLAVRAAGYGLNICFVQFMKNGKSSETRILESIPEIEYYCPGNHEWVSDEMTELQEMHALAGLDYVLQIPEKTNLLICDEILNIPLFGPFTYENIEEIIKTKHPDLELVLTGLYCPQSILELADYASEIREENHPFKHGIIARPGIEY